MSEIERVPSVSPEEFWGDLRLPFDRLDDEPKDHFMLFAGYRDLGSKRSMTKLAEMTGLSRSRLQPIAARNSWGARAEAYDIEIARIALSALEGDQTSMRVRHAEIARILMDKAASAAELVDPAFLSPRDVAPWLDVASKLERASKGLLDTKRIEVTGKGGDPIKVVSEMSSEDRQQLMLEARAELNRRLGQASIAWTEDIQDADVVTESEDE